MVRTPQFAWILRVVLVLAILGPWAGQAPLAQSPQVGPNVNMVSGTDWPNGDPFLQRQNEGSIAASTRNPLHLLAGANDYRTVDLPGLPDGKVTGDAWLGLFKSFDGGLTWRSTLLPGYPQDTSSIGMASPLKGYQAGADATVRAGTNGLFFYSGIVFDRPVAPSARANEKQPGTRIARARNRGRAITAGDALGNTSAVFVARFIDNNNRPNGDPIDYIGTAVIKSSPNVVFIDKPWLIADIPRLGAPTCTIPQTVNGGPQTFHGGRVYVTFTEVEGTGPNTRARIMFSRSTTCGQTWSTPKEISIGHQLNQGSSMAINPLTGELYVVWRRLKAGTQGDAIMVAKSQNGGSTFTLPIKISNITPFDQGTSFISTRTTAYPTITLDYFPRVYVAWSNRLVNPDPNDVDAVIALATSNGHVTSGAPDNDDVGTSPNDAMSWSLPVAVDNPPVGPNVPTGRGHQIMPSLSFAAGKLMLVYYDLRLDNTTGVFTRDPVTGALVESRAPAGDLPGSPNKVFSPFIAEAEFTGYDPVTGNPTFADTLLRRHTIDVVAAQASPGPAPVFSTRRVSQYRAGSRPNSVLIEQLQYNPPLLPLFACAGILANCRPFFGDYIDLSPSPAFRTDPFGFWIPNVLPLSTPVFHTIWTDNRDVRPPPDGNWQNYTPPSNAPPPPSGGSLFDPQQTRPGCTPSGPGLTTAGMRNQNVYTARVSGGLYVSALDNSKQLGGIQRTFAVTVQNATEAIKHFRLRIRPRSGVAASFLQFQSLMQLDVSVAPRSSISRPVFVTSSNRRARVIVDVNEITQPDGPLVPGGLMSDLVLNPDITNPDITNPDITNAEVYNPDITNPDITNPDITNPDITNPDITNPDITNPDITNPDITNPDITNPDITNPDITNPDITNPDITNPDITNGSVSDTTWEVENKGTTSASYSVKLLLNGAVPPGFKLQLILHRIYTTPVPDNCNLGLQSHNVLIANIRNPEFTDAADLANPDITNPDITNATLSLGPNEKGKITLRVVDPNRFDAVTFNAATAVTPAIVSHAVNTTEAAGGSTTPPIATPGSSSGVVFITQPPPLGTAGTALTPAVRVQMRDPETGAVSAGVLVTLSLGSNPTGATLSGNTATTNALGIATFPSLTVSQAGEGFTLIVPAFEGPPRAVSTPFSIASPPSATIIVTNTNNSGLGSLRAAIDSANANDGVVDTIRFNITGDGPPYTIGVSSALPPITDPVIIDGTTQPGYAGTPIVELSGIEEGPGLTITAGNSTVRGLIINSFSGSGILIQGCPEAPCGEAGTGGNRVQGNFIGTNSSGTEPDANTFNGVHIIDSPNNTIGGTTSAARNVISGNQGEGVRIDGAIATGNVIQGNYIGTSPSGLADMGNSASGVYIRRAPSNSVIGNLVSGNDGFAGVAICGNPTFCGGGDIGTAGSSAHNNVVLGNNIGLKADGSSPSLGNAGYGVSIDSAPDTRVGGTTAAFRNVITASGQHGVVVFGPGAVNNQILGNSIHSNTGLGIDLGADGVTPNDYGGEFQPPDLDMGPNEFQNFPDLFSALLSTNTVVTGQLRSAAGELFRIEVFVAPTCHASGHGEGRQFLGSFVVQADGFGVANFSQAFRATTLGHYITATATSSGGSASTSEFSACQVISNPEP
jgi:uncharacterized protein YjbI with pentapeptide repeats